MKSNNFVEIGNQIRKIREEAKMSQEDLAFSINIGQSAISKLERLGPTAVSWPALQSIVRALGYKIEIKLIKD